MYPTLRQGDMIKFTMLVPTLIVPPIMAPVPLVASGFHKINSMPVCLDGDELPPSLLVPLPYTDGSFTIPGMGTIKLTLLPIHLSKVDKDRGKPLLLQGTPFQAQFQVSAPAQMPAPPAPPIPDPAPSKPLLVEYITMNRVEKSN